MSLQEWARATIGKREDVDALVNEGIEVVVGGAGVTKPKTVLLREPSMARFAKHVRIIATGVSAAFKDVRGEAVLKKTVQDLQSGATPTDFNLGDLIKATPISDALSDLIADLVSEDRAYVNEEMTPKQVGKVLSTYAKLIGWETIERFFVQAMTRGAQYAEKMAVKERQTT